MDVLGIGGGAMLLGLVLLSFSKKEGEIVILFYFCNVVILFNKFSATFLDRLGVEGSLSASKFLDLTVDLAVSLAVSLTFYCSNSRSVRRFD